MWVCVRYAFRQPFAVEADRAYAWCTDFRPQDGALYSRRTLRRVDRLTDDAYLLTDTPFPLGRPRTIRRLVRLAPAERAWSSTHLDGPFRHSQFWYRIVRGGRGRSYLDFRALKLERAAHPLSAGELRRRATRNQRADADVWANRFAPAMAREVGRALSRDRPGATRAGAKARRGSRRPVAPSRLRRDLRAPRRRSTGSLPSVPRPNGAATPAARGPGIL